MVALSPTATPSRLPDEFAADESSGAASHGMLVEDCQRARLTNGTRVGRYVVQECLGEAGAGVEYAAYDPEFDRRITLKLAPRRASGPAAMFLRKKLLREARTMAKLTRPRAASVYDTGTFDNQFFVAMEFVDRPRVPAWKRTAQVASLLGVLALVGFACGRRAVFPPKPSLVVTAVSPRASDPSSALFDVLAMPALAGHRSKETAETVKDAPDVRSRAPALSAMATRPFTASAASRPDPGSYQ